MEKEFLKMMKSLVTGAFGLIAALAWNTAITELVNRYFRPGTGILAMFVYAALVTALAFLVVWSLSRILPEA